ncbi:hypothetical protein, partial [Sphingobacterium faecium]|uniref:hypothetical protein n=2 Tax=Sphingobacterium faecium TaxID=34087 RepID=UPI001C9A011E
GELTFKPISDGMKDTYYLNGILYSRGKIENLKQNGLWSFGIQMEKKHGKVNLLMENLTARTITGFPMGTKGLQETGRMVYMTVFGK